MILEIICVLLLIIILAMVIPAMRLMKKVEFYENWISEFKRKVNCVYNGITEVDTLGAFEAEDETGFAFTEIKNLVEELNGFVTIEEEVWNTKK